jgi:DNA-binding response OmpR family regulator
MLQPRPKVLVADDDHNLRQLLMEALPKHKFEVYQAADGPESWDTIKNLRPDLVLLDVMMPGMDGHEICRLMRDNPQTRNIPVIMLTARAQLQDKLDGIESGADDYITKPFDPLELQARIEMHLRRYLRDSDMSPVTELPGNKSIEQALIERIESGRKFALLYVDLDDFKAFNDYYGQRCHPHDGRYPRRSTPEQSEWRRFSRPRRRRRLYCGNSARFCGSRV